MNSPKYLQSGTWTNSLYVLSSVVLWFCYRLLSSFFSFLLGLFVRRPPRPTLPEDDLPRAKVAIIGAGIGGCFAAKFLRENGGKKLDIHVFAKKGSEVGGRTAVCQFKGHIYETGASVFHSDNRHLVDAAKQHGESIIAVYVHCYRTN